MKFGKIANLIGQLINSIFLLSLATWTAGAANGMWSGANGDWSASANWTGGVPGSAGETATFGNLTTSGTYTITLDAPVTVGKLDFSTSYVGANTTAKWVLAGAAQTLTLNNGAGAPVITINRGGAGALTVEYDGILAGGNGFTKEGDGILVFTNAAAVHTITGTMAINGGRVDLAGNSTQINTVWAGITDFALNNGGLLRFTTDGGGSTLNASQTITVGAGGGGVSITGYSGRTIGAAIKGTGTLTLTANARVLVVAGDAGGFTGAYNLVNPVQLNASALVNNNKIFIGDNGGLVGTAGKYTTFQEWLDSGLIDVNSTGAMVIAAATVSQTIDFTNYANLSLGTSDLTTFTGTIIAANNTYRLGGGSNAIQLNRENILTGDRRLVVGNDTLGGSIRLMQANDYTGGTEITKNASLVIDRADAIGSGDIVSRGSLNLAGAGGFAVSANLTTQGLSSSGDIGNILVSTAGNFAWNGDITVDAAAAGLGSARFTLNRTAGSTLTVNGDINLRGGSLILNNYGSSGAAYGGFVINGVISGSYNITKSFLSNLTLNAANTFNGTLTLDGGNLTLGNSLALQNATLSLTTGTGAGNDNSVLFASGVTDAQLGGLVNGWTGRSIKLENADSEAVSLRIVSKSAVDTGLSVSLTGKGGLGYDGAKTLFLRGVNTYTGDTVVRGGVLALDWAGSATATLSSQTRLTLAGGEFRVNSRSNTANSQTLNGLNLEAGASKLNVTTSGTSVSTLNLGAITRDSGATLDITAPIAARGAITTAAANDSTGILGGYATFGGTTWASVDGNGNIVGNTAYVSTLDPGANVSLAGTVNASGTKDINSLRLHSQATLNADDALRVTSGGILMTNGASSSAINAATLTSGNGSDLIIHQNRTVLTDKLTINATITDDGATGIGLTKSGVGQLVLTKANTYSGDTRVNAGTLLVESAATLGTGDVYVASGATLLLQNAAALDSQASLWFDTRAAKINLDFTDGMTLASVNLSNLSLTLSTPRDWYADDLNNYFNVTLFSGAGFITIIPEPSTWLLLAAGGTLLACLRRRAK